MATGRSDYPNQVNNVLGFPFIFRGALDVRATAINEEMKLAATRALAALAKEDVPDSVCRAYGVERLKFGPDYLIPKPFDPRVLIWEASAVAEAAMRSGVARSRSISKLYREQLERRLGKAHEISAHDDPQGADQAQAGGLSRRRQRENSARLPQPPGRADRVPDPAGERSDHPRQKQELGLDLDGCGLSIRHIAAARRLHPGTVPPAAATGRHAIGSPYAHQRPQYFRFHDGATWATADALVAGVTQHFPDTIRPALQIVRMREGLHKVSGCYAMITRNGDLYFLADTSVNIDPTAEDLVEIALCTAETARRFDVVPRVAMLSFSSFGSTKHPLCEKVRKAVELLHKADPTLMVDGEIMADAAVSPDMLEQIYPFSTLKGGANVLIFPDLAPPILPTSCCRKSAEQRRWAPS